MSFLVPKRSWISFTAFPSEFTDSRSEIYLIRPDGSDLRKLTFSPGYITNPSWAPDGKSIVFSQLTQKPEQTDVNLYVVETASGRVRQLTDTPDIYEHSPAYAPDGKSIAYTAVKPDESPSIFELMIMDVNGENERKMFKDSIYVDDYAWSPDGKYIAIIVQNDSSPDWEDSLYVIDADGNNLRRLTDRPGCVGFPNWSPDGQWITFGYSPNKCGASGPWQLNLINITGNESITIASPMGSFQVPVLSPLPAIAKGESYVVTESGSLLNLRATHSLIGEVLSKLDEGEKISVLEGPVVAEDFLWWRVQVGSTNLEGWVAENPGWFARE